MSKWNITKIEVIPKDKPDEPQRWKITMDQHNVRTKTIEMDEINQSIVDHEEGEQNWEAMKVFCLAELAKKEAEEE